MGQQMGRNCDKAFTRHFSRIVEFARALTPSVRVQE
jgi:hypothetical protein